MDDKPRSKHHHRIVPIAGITFGIPIALVVGLLLVANLIWHDERAPDDAMFYLSDVTVAEAENAYTDVQKLKEDFMAVDPNVWQPPADAKVDEMLNGTTWDEAYATDVLNKYALAISDFQSAAKQAQYQDPYAAHPNTWTFNSPLDNLGPVRFVGKLAALEGLQKMKNGDAPGGLAEAVGVARLGYLLESGQGTFIQNLVGGATKQVGLTAIRQISIQSPPTAEVAQTTAQKLEQYRDGPTGLVKAMKLEYMAFKSYQPQFRHLDTMYGMYNLTTDVTTGQTQDGHSLAAAILDRTGLTRLYYWPNQTWRFAIEQRQQEMAVVQTDCATGNLNPTTTTVSRRHGFGRLFEPNAIGKYLADIGRIEFGSVAVKQCNESLAISATQAALAVSAYQHDNNKLPVSLDTLVPTYLTAAPIDPYSGQALKYLPEKKTVYSVGPKRVDLGGSPGGSDWPQQDNPSFSVGQ